MSLQKIADRAQLNVEGSNGNKELAEEVKSLKKEFNEFKSIMEEFCMN